MLDERFRRGIGGLVGTDEGGLDPDARERVVARLVAEGPGLVRRAKRWRVATLSAYPLLAAAAAVAVLGVQHRRATATSAPSARAVPVAAVAAPPVCASRDVPDGAKRGFVAGTEGSSLELGAVAFAVGMPGSVVRLSEAASCRTVLSLDSGTVAVHAKDLGGGELHVRAPGGDVAVRGTIFAVTQDADSLVVEVAQGRVSVTDRSGEHIVSTGERLLLSSVGIAEGALAPDRAHALRAILDAPEVVDLEKLQPVGADAPAGAVAPAPVPKGSAPTVHALVGVGVAAPSAAPEASAVELAEDKGAPATPSSPAGAPSSEPPVHQDPLTLAEEARRSGDFPRARQLYMQAGAGRGVTAEAAWVALARMELSLGHTAAAREATKRRQDLFGQGTLGPEALWIDVRTFRQTGDMARARELAASLVQRWPSSPQALAARQWLGAE